MFEYSAPAKSRDPLTDWMLRGSIALFFGLFGLDKFGEGWIELFRQIGIGDWFRYTTGIVEILGAILVLIPGTVTLGLAILAATMASAACILTFMLHRPADSVFSLAFLVGLTVFWWNRRS